VGALKGGPARITAAVAREGVKEEERADRWDQRDRERRGEPGERLEQGKRAPTGGPGVADREERGGVRLGWLGRGKER
jgi:hypothetical protein